MLERNEKIRRDAFTTESGIVKSVSYFIAPVKKHKEILKLLQEEIGDIKSLEVSSFSEVELGRKLSAFNIPYRGKCLECVYQAAKVFEKGGPYKEWLEMSPRDVKKDPRKKASGKVIHYEFDNQIWSLEPRTAFYDYIYIDAVRNLLSESDLKEILKYQYFTDVALDPEVSTNCQARSMALIQLMVKKYGRIPEFKNKDDFIALHKQNVSYELS